MKILIVSGFLGAGKTTFIKALAKYTGKEFAVLENEYGSTGIDGERLNESLTNGDVNIWELADGCICCSAKGDFTASVLTIANAVDPEYLIIEPTGVGMLGRIIQNLQQIVYERISLLAPITIVDIHSYQRYEQEYEELYRNQIREAGTIIVSKSEDSTTLEKEAVKNVLRKSNATANIIVDHYSLLSHKAWIQLLKTNYDGSVEETGEQIQKLPDSFSFSNISIQSIEKLICFLEDLIRGQYGDIIRAKGQLCAGQLIVQFDVSDGRYCIEGLDKITVGKAVFIGNQISRQKIRRHFMRRYKVKS